MSNNFLKYARVTDVDFNDDGVSFVVAQLDTKRNKVNKFYCHTSFPMSSRELEVYFDDTRIHMTQEMSLEFVKMAQESLGIRYELDEDENGDISVYAVAE